MLTCVAMAIKECSNENENGKENIKEESEVTVTTRDEDSILFL